MAAVAVIAASISHVTASETASEYPQAPDAAVRYGEAFR